MIHLFISLIIAHLLSIKGSTLPLFHTNPHNSAQTDLKYRDSLKTYCRNLIPGFESRKEILKDMKSNINLHTRVTESEINLENFQSPGIYLVISLNIRTVDFKLLVCNIPLPSKTNETSSIELINLFELEIDSFKDPENTTWNDAIAEIIQQRLLDIVRLNQVKEAILVFEDYTLHRSFDKTIIREDANNWNFKVENNKNSPSIFSSFNGSLLKRNITSFVAKYATEKVEFTHFSHSISMDKSVGTDYSSLFLFPSSFSILKKENSDNGLSFIGTKYLGAFDVTKNIFSVFTTAELTVIRNFFQGQGLFEIISTKEFLVKSVIENLKDFHLKCKTVQFDYKSLDYEMISTLLEKRELSESIDYFYGIRNMTLNILYRLCKLYVLKIKAIKECLNLNPTKIYLKEFEITQNDIIGHIITENCTKRLEKQNLLSFGYSEEIETRF